MAVRALEDQETLKINVVMKDGREYLGCDIPERPMGEYDRILAFWVGNAVRIVPMQDVLYAEYYTDQNQP